MTRSFDYHSFATANAAAARRNPTSCAASRKKIGDWRFVRNEERRAAIAGARVEAGVEGHSCYPSSLG